MPSPPRGGLAEEGKLEGSDDTRFGGSASMKHLPNSDGCKEVASDWG